MTPTQSHWEEEYKSLYNLFCHERSISKKLKLEIRSLQRKLRDSNRGAERLHLINAHLRGAVAIYKLKHPETTVGIDLAKDKDQSVTYTYDSKAHTAKILQQQQDGI